MAQTLALGVAGATPMLFIAIDQIRRACGDRLFGSRERFCSSRQVWTWLWSLPIWVQSGIFLLIIAAVLLVRRSAMKIAS